MRGPGDGEERGTGQAPAARRLASWLRARRRIGRPADAPDAVESPAAPAADRTAEPAPPPPPSRLRPQPEDDASVYPLF
ncbi:hypothetical protein IQ62_28540 [Streptomyces scabiei]|uniref:hypothetical protein n=1 Tax=Streptomyces scabiei TaxID=1930 RepID=UPI0004E7240F|nr:hypothetical protein [Streptomyces scabiei]KFF97804.1 hypothetical protein IQ62_28540 [Streptomyces scabiei]